MLSTTLLGDQNLPKVVFLHGFLGSKQDWLEVSEPLKEHYCCVLIDLPAHGDSKIPAINLKTSLHAILKTVEHHCPLGCSLIGYSMGGRLAMLLAEQFPQLVTSLVIVSANPGICEDQKKQRIEKDLYWHDVLGKFSFEEFLSRWYDQPLFCYLKENPNLLLKIKENKAKPKRIAALQQALVQLSVAKQKNLSSRLPRGLYLCGELDHKYIDLYKRLNTSSFKVIPKSGHIIHVENPKFLAQTIKEYLCKELHVKSTQT